MWHVEVVCSDPNCAEEIELWVEDLDEIEDAVCDCECGVITRAVAVHEPLGIRIAVPV
jgi:hypothetical protein